MARSRLAGLQGHLVFRAVGASLLLALLVGGAFAVLLVAVDNLRDSGRRAATTRDELRVADGLEKLVIDLETGERGFVITRQERLLDPWRRARANVPRQSQRLIRLADRPDQRRRARQIAAAIAGYIRDYSAPIVDAARRHDPRASSAAATLEGKRKVDAIRRLFQGFTLAERELLTARQDQDDRDTEQAITAALIGVSASVLVTLIVGGYLMRSIVLPVRRLSSATASVARGDLAVRIPDGGIAEIGELERNFNVMAVSLEQNAAELTASRARVVLAADESRRRIERDLHDGAQQRLVHAVIALKLAQRAYESGAAGTSKLLDEALEHAELATAELRELAHGILPPVLTRLGLRVAVQSLASRFTVPVSVDIPARRLAEATEATAYFIVAEALTNVVKHAQATRAEVEATLDNGTMTLQIRDDGVGGARVQGGSGLLGLRDRAAAAGGWLSVESPHGGGTTITVTLPLDAPAATSSSDTSAPPERGDAPSAPA